MDFKDRPCFKSTQKNYLAKDCREKITAVGDERRVGALHAGDTLRRLSALNDSFSAPKKTILKGFISI